MPGLRELLNRFRPTDAPGAGRHRRTGARLLGARTADATSFRAFAAARPCMIEYCRAPRTRLDSANPAMRSIGVSQDLQI